MPKRSLSYQLRKRASEESPNLGASPNSVGGGEGLLAVHDFNDVPKSDREAFQQEASKLSEIGLFEGSVQHGYAAAFSVDLDRCPRCGGRTEKKYANFIYATELAIRVMFAPAGHFCSNCPSVIIEEDMIAAGMLDRRFKYKCVVGIDFERKKPEFFKTWNDEDLVFIVDEVEQSVVVTTRAEIERPTEMEIVSSHTIVPPNLAKKKAIKKKRDKLAKLSRKKNRRK